MSPHRQRLLESAGTLCCLLALALAAGCAKDAPNTRTQTFFVEWLQAHGETNIVVDAGGVGLEGSAVRLKASLYDSKPQPDGGYTAEMEFRIRLPAQGEIIEYLAGMGDTEQQALNDCLVNFTLTTFHVIYAGFLNPGDPHQTAEQVAINGMNREVICGDLYLRHGEMSPPLDLNVMRSPLLNAVAGLPLAGGPHWIKIVYCQFEGKPVSVAASLDNADHEELTSAIGALDWPARDEFYMVKQFILVK